MASMQMSLQHVHDGKTPHASTSATPPMQMILRQSSNTYNQDGSIKTKISHVGESRSGSSHPLSSPAHAGIPSYITPKQVPQTSPHRSPPIRVTLKPPSPTTHLSSQFTTLPTESTDLISPHCSTHAPTTLKHQQPVPHLTRAFHEIRP